MSRYIDLDEAKARTTQLVHGYEVEQWLDTIPSVDIDRPQGERDKEIVRCEACAKWRKDRFFCTQWTCGTPAVGWCYMAKQTERSE